MVEGSRHRSLCAPWTNRSSMDMYKNINQHNKYINYGVLVVRLILHAYK